MQKIVRSHPVIMHKRGKNGVVRYIRNVKMEHNTTKSKIIGSEGPALNSLIFDKVEHNWCSKHTYYKAIRPPKADCWVCKVLYEERIKTISSGKIIGRGK